MLYLSAWPKSVVVLGVRFKVEWWEFEDDTQGQMEYEPEDSAVRIRVAKRFAGQPWAWQILFHELTHAALAVSGVSEAMDGKVEESVAVASEAVWQALGRMQADEQRAKRVASKGSKGRGTRRSPTKRRGR